jgi:serine phosphatase RsbU (regulator of sigma subunit)
MLLSVGGLTGFLLLALQALSIYGARTLTNSSLQRTSLLLARYQAAKVDSSLAFAETSSEAILRATEHSDLLENKAHLVTYLTEIMQGDKQVSAIEAHPAEGPPIVVRRTADDLFVQAAPVYDRELIKKLSLQEQIAGVWNVSGRSDEIARAYHVQSRKGTQLYIEVPFHLLSEPLEVSAGNAYGFLATESKIYFDERLTGIKESPEWSSFSSHVLMGPVDGDGFRVVSDPLHHKPAYVGAARVGDLPLKAGVVYLESDQFNLVRELVWWTIGLSVMGIIVILVVTNILSKDISAPLVQLCAKVDAAAESDFEGQIETSPQASSEIVGLAGSFNKLLDDVRSHLRNLESAVATRQALESELSIASRIQESILPDFPFLSEVAEAEGVSIPARQVGGDFLDVYPIDQDRIGFCLGDVSGKGAPAAIYMAFTASLLEHLGRLNVTPSECARIINESLCERQEPSMFATVFFGVLDRSGEVRYCNAGHHPPMILQPEGGFRELEVESGLGLGILDSFEFGESTFQLGKGETMLLYTDGLTEAMNSKKEEFGEERLAEFLTAQGKKRPLIELLANLSKTVEEFRDGADPNDDFTVLFIRRGQD